MNIRSLYLYLKCVRIIKMRCWLNFLEYVHLLIPNLLTRTVYKELARGAGFFPLIVSLHSASLPSTREGQLTSLLYKVSPP